MFRTSSRPLEDGLVARTGCHLFITSTSEFRSCIEKQRMIAFAFSTSFNNGSESDWRSSYTRRWTRTDCPCAFSNSYVSPSPPLGTGSNLSARTEHRTPRNRTKQLGVWLPDMQSAQEINNSLDWCAIIHSLFYRSRCGSFLMPFLEKVLCAVLPLL